MNVEKMEMYKQSGVLILDEYFLLDVEFMVQVEECLGSCFIEEQCCYFDGVDSLVGIDLNLYFGCEIEYFDVVLFMLELELEMVVDFEVE